MAGKISQMTAAGTLAGTELLEVSVPAAGSPTTYTTRSATAQEIADLAPGNDLAGTIHAATGKTTPVDADEMALVDSAESPAFTLKKLTWSNIKATLKTYFDTLYASVSSSSVELRGLTFTSDTGSTADSDPGAGLFKWNNATQSSATYLYFDETTTDSVNLDTFFASLGTAGFIYLQQSDDSTKWQLWKWTAVATDGTGYWKLPVTLQASGGSIADNKTVFADFTGAGGSSSSGGTKTYAVHTPMTSFPPGSNGATPDTRNYIPVLDFDAATDESAYWVGIIPEAADLTSGLKIRIYWMATSATSGACRWGVQIERTGTDLDSDSFDTAATAGTTCSGTSGIEVVTEITITTIDSLAAGERYRLKVYRDADGTSGTDDMTGDAELVAVEVRSAA